VTGTTKSVLIVEDDPALVRVLRSALGTFQREHVFRIAVAADGAEALATLERAQFDLVLLDMYMPRMTGLEVLAQMRRLNVRSPVLMMTGNNDAQAAAEAIAAGIFAYIPKPLDLRRLEHLVSLAVSMGTPEVTK
jgi:two-component system, NtrC family, response regulator AtoC